MATQLYLFNNFGIELPNSVQYSTPPFVLFQYTVEVLTLASSSSSSSSSSSAGHATASRLPPQLLPLNSVLCDSHSVVSKHLFNLIPPSSLWLSFPLLLSLGCHSVVVLAHLLFCIRATCPAQFLFLSLAV